MISTTFNYTAAVPVGPLVLQFLTNDTQQSVQNMFQNLSRLPTTIASLANSKMHIRTPIPTK